MAVSRRESAVINLHQIQLEAAACDPADLEQLAWRFWRRGMPCRLVHLPPQWWEQSNEIDAGLWIAADDQDPPQWWLVQQRSNHCKWHPLRKGSVDGITPNQLQLRALSIWPPLSGPAKSWRTLGRYLQLGASIRRVIPAAVLRSAVWLLFPVLLAALLTKQIPPQEVFFLALGSMIVGVVLDSYWRREWLNRSERQGSALGINAMHRILQLPLPLLKELSGPGAISLGVALQQLGQDLPLALGRCIPTASLLISTNLVLLVWQPQLGVITLAACSSWLTVSVLFMKSSSRLGAEQNRHYAREQLRGQELIESASTLRIAGAEQRALSWWRQGASEAELLQIKLDRGVLVLAALGLIASFVSVIAAVQIQDRTTVLVALSLIGLQLGSCNQLSGQIRESEQFLLSWRGAQLLLNSPSAWRPEAIDPGVLHGDLLVENLSFRYGSDQRLVLNQVSFKAVAGSFIAVVGSSGSGKSTLLRLLLGLETPTSGTIEFDGHNQKDIEYELLRPQIGTVLQNTQLVGGTMLEVIAAGRSISLEQAWSAVEKAGLAEELKALPMGMQTTVSAGGRSLCGGQRQQLAIARALAGNPRLLFLDEPTSALDNKIQHNVLKSLEALAITKVLVAHRLSTVIKADLILVLNEGKLVQQGGYRELMNQPGAFAQLMQRQRL